MKDWELFWATVIPFVVGGAVGIIVGLLLAGGPE